MASTSSTIKRLDEVVINRIAAGEVIQRPANAVKEMLENSLDAGASILTVAVKSGGLKMLQISDNGHGVRKEDMNIVCERFTTSKLQEFDDLKTISTFGFRGEALASISHVAHLSITSRTKDSQCAYKASYLDGKLNGSLRPSAGNVGTQITVEDLFYNVPTRRKAFKSHSEEHQKIANVITKYAIHNSGISFTLRKADVDSGQVASVTVRTQENATITDNISSIYGASVGKELLEVKHEDSKLRLKVNGWASNANCSMKKFTFLLFINNRLVDCSSLKRGLDAVYQTYLPKGGHPFIYLSLTMEPSNVDVNVHPTKHEVHFLNEEAVIECVQKAVENKLLSCDSSRTFYTQKLLPIAPKLAVEENLKTSHKKDQHSKPYDHELVRTDNKLRKLESFFSKSAVSRAAIPSKSAETTQAQPVRPESKKRSNLTIANLRRRREIKLTSVLQLQEEFKASVSRDLLKILRELTFVGIADAEFALIQHLTKLYLVNTTKLTQELFYQILLTDFGNFGLFRLSEPAPIFELAMLGLECDESGWTPADGSKDNLAKFIRDFLLEKSEMLKDYFSFEVKDGNVTGLPMLLQSYAPALEGLPMLLLRLSTEVNWESEKECFKTVCSELARFYCVRKGYTDGESLIKEHEKNVSKPTNGDEDNDEGSSTQSSTETWQWTVEHVIFPALKQHLLPTHKMAEDGTFLQLANLPDLYKVFERC